MECLAGGRGTNCTRWLMFAGMLASAVAAFMLVSRLTEAGTPVREGSDDIYGM